jgi:hypothetical protein
MRGGAEFPPIVVSSDAYIIDANTRVEAARSIKVPSLPALVITPPFKTSPTDVQNKYKALAATLNQLGGQRLTTAESKDAAVTLIHLGWNTPNISRALGLSSQIAAKIRKMELARERMTRLGLIPPKAEYMTTCGQPAMLSLNDEPYRRMVLLIQDANLSHREATEIAVAVGKTGSDQAALDLIATYRAQMEDRIRAHALTGNGKPSSAAKFRRALGNVLGWQGREEEAVDSDATSCQAHYDKLIDARKMLDEIVTLQEEATPDVART